MVGGSQSQRRAFFFGGAKHVQKPARTFDGHRLSPVLELDMRRIEPGGLAPLDQGLQIPIAEVAVVAAGVSASPGYGTSGGSAIPALITPDEAARRKALRHVQASAPHRADHKDTFTWGCCSRV